MKTYLKYSLFLLGTILFAYILYSINLQKTVEIILSAQLIFLLSASAIYICIIVLKIYKWRLMLKIHNLPYDFKSAAKSWLASLPIESFTPGRIGYLARIAFYEDKKAAASAATIDKVFDMLGLMICAMAGTLFFVVWFGKLLILVPLFALEIALIILIVVVAYNKALAKKFVHHFKQIVPKFLKQKFGTQIKEIYLKLNNAARIGKKELVLNFLASLLEWILVAPFAFFILKSVSVDLGFLKTFAAISVTALAGIVPVTILGIGTNEVSLIFLLSLFSIPAEKAVATSLLLLFVNILASAIGLVVLIASKKSKSPSPPATF